MKFLSQTLKVRAYENPPPTGKMASTIEQAHAVCKDSAKSTSRSREQVEYRQPTSPMESAWLQLSYRVKTVPFLNFMPLIPGRDNEHEGRKEWSLQSKRVIPTELMVRCYAVSHLKNAQQHTTENQITPRMNEPHGELHRTPC